MAALETSRGGWDEVGEIMEPVSPTGQYFNSSVLSVGILGVFEFDIPVDDFPTMSTLTHTFLPINTRFSSVMVRDEHGVRQWKRVKVRLEDHVHIPVFPAGLPPESYDVYFQEYLSKIAMEHLPQSRPLWDVHIIKYPLKNAAGALVIRLHHSMGDGFSLMGALFSCLKRADDPSKTLTFPSSSSQSKAQDRGGGGICRNISTYLSALYNTASDFAFSLLKSNFVEDDRTAVRSGTEGVEFRPMTISTVDFSLEQIRQVKSRLGGTINDVISGIVFHGVRLYMQRSAHNPSDEEARVTALVLLNTRVVGQYQSVKEMMDPDAESPWGNQFGFLHVSVPPFSKKMNGKDRPLEFVFKAREMIQRKRNSLAVVLTGRILELIRKIKGPEATAQYIHSTLRNTSMTISNLIGPMEQMSVADHPVRGFYFMVVGSPQSLTITMVSYRGELKMAIGMEKWYIDPQLFISCMERAFDTIFEAAMGVPRTRPT